MQDQALAIRMLQKASGLLGVPPIFFYSTSILSYQIYVLVDEDEEAKCGTGNIFCAISDDLS